MSNEEQKPNVWLIDIDGTVCEDIPNEQSHLFPSAYVYEGALEKVLELQKTGDIFFFTARRSEHAEATEEWLTRHGFPFERVIYDKPRIKKGQTYNWVDNRFVLGHWVPRGITQL